MTKTNTIKIWKTVNQIPPLQKDEVHVWRVSLKEIFTDETDKIERELNVLSLQEKARADRFLQVRDRRSFIASHVTLHSILIGYLPELQTPLRFHYNEYGKPYLVDSSILQFNLSNSHSMVLCAVAHNQEVGIDVEYMKRNVRINKITRRFFSMEESISIQKLPIKEQVTRFYDLWTLKEAYTKVIGQGLSFLFNRFTTNTNIAGTKVGTKINRSVNICGDCKKAKSSSWIISIPVGKNYKAALAVEKPPKIVHYFNWTASM